MRRGSSCWSAIASSAPPFVDGAPVGDRWRIEPIQVSLSGTTLTITGRAWLIVRPVLYVGFAFRGACGCSGGKTVFGYEQPASMFVRQAASG